MGKEGEMFNKANNLAECIIINTVKIQHLQVTIVDNLKLTAAPIY